MGLRTTVYYHNWGRDCDGIEASRVCKFDTLAKAEKAIDDDYKWADGPTNWTKITRRQYREFIAANPGYVRDRYAEAAGY